MMRKGIFLVTLAFSFDLMIQAEGVCFPWQGAGTINLCKNPGKTNCLGVSSGNTCINLIGGPFVSGYSSGGYSCTIYAGRGCADTAISVDREGWSRFPITPLSIRCPCN